MRKYIIPILFINFWGCEENNDSSNSEPKFITMDVNDVECVEIGQYENIECDFLQLTVPFNSNGSTPNVSYSEGNEPYLWNPLPFTDCIEDRESDGIYDESDGCWDINFTFTYTTDSVTIKWEVDANLDLGWEEYSYLGINNNFWNSVYKIEN
jgi:hypothetical protein